MDRLAEGALAWEKTIFWEDVRFSRSQSMCWDIISIKYFAILHVSLIKIEFGTFSPPRPCTNQQHLIAKQANQHAKYYHLSEYDHRVYVFKLGVKVDQGLMVSNVLLKFLVTFVHVLCQCRIFFAHFVLYVAQFRESVPEYAKLAGQMDGHDAENVVEAKVTDPYVIQSYYL